MARGQRKKVDLTYLGPATTFYDRTTGLTWGIGQTHRISEKDVERIQKAVPQDEWSVKEAAGDPPVQPPEPKKEEKPEETSGFPTENR